MRGLTGATSKVSGAMAAAVKAPYSSCMPCARSSAPAPHLGKVPTRQPPPLNDKHPCFVKKHRQMIHLK